MSFFLFVRANRLIRSKFDSLFFSPSIDVDVVWDGGLLVKPAALLRADLVGEGRGRAQLDEERVERRLQRRLGDGGGARRRREEGRHHLCSSADRRFHKKVKTTKTFDTTSL